jgi:hypothetical protein
MLSKAFFAGLALLLSVGHAYASVAREIVNLATGLRVDVKGASKAPMTGAILWPDNASGSQEFWLLQNRSDQFFYLMADHSEQCLMLDWRNGNYHNGTLVIQFPHCWNDPHEPYPAAEWEWSYVVDNCHIEWQDCGLDRRMILVNKATGKCLDAGNALGGKPPQGAVLQVWDCITSIGQWNAGNQLWTTAHTTSRKPER